MTLLLFLFSSLLFSTTAAANCDLQLQYSLPLRASYLDAAADGNDLWTATGHGVRLFDRSNPAPQLLDSEALPGITGLIRARAGVAYAASGSTIHVLRRSGDAIEKVRAFDAPATINDLLIAGSTLWVATSNGIASYSLADPLSPAGGLTNLQTSNRDVRSLAASGAAIVAADGDTSVEVFIGSGLTGTFTSGLRATSVNVVSSRIFVSDGQQTEIFIGSTRLATLPFGTVSAATIANDVVFLAGNDRRYRIVDIANAESPIELFSGDIAPTGGTINRVGNIEVAGSRAYVAGGDGGLLTFDTTEFAPPYPLRIYAIGPKTSIVAGATSLYVAGATGGITELTRSALGGGLTATRTWEETTAHIVHDTANDFLLTSSGTTARFWTLRSTSPTIVSTAVFRAPVKSASLVGTTAYALLDDGSLWSANLAQENATPVAALPGPIAFASVSNRGAVVAETRLEGTTVVRFYANAQFGSTPATVTIEGIPTALALNESRAALFTFRGTSVIDFGSASPSVTLLPGSNASVVTDLALAGGRLLDASASGIRIWNLTTNAIAEQIATSSEPVAVAIAPGGEFAGAATGIGVASLNLQTQSRQPQLASIAGGNVYPRKLVATSKHLFLFDGQSVAIFFTGASPAPDHIATVITPGAVDIAASDTRLFTLTSSGAVNVYGTSGVLLRSTTLNEGSDVAPLAIFSAGGAPWVSISKGCLSTGCEKQTLVFDPNNLVRSAVLPGGAIDVTTNGSSAWAIFDLPAELRAYNISDPLHPAVTASRASEGSAASIAFANNLVYVLGTRLFSYTSTGLAPTGEQLTNETVSSSTRLAINNNCAFVSGRGRSIQRYVVGSTWTSSAAPATSGTPRWIASAGGRFYVLTDYALDIWGTVLNGTPPSRRRIATRP